MTTTNTGLELAIAGLEGVAYSKKEESFLSMLNSPSETELFDIGKEQLQNLLDIRFLVDVTETRSCLLRILVVKTPIAIKGIDTPVGFCYYRPPTIDEYKSLIAGWRGALKELQHMSVAEFWYPVLVPKSRATTPPIELYVGTMASIDSRYNSQYGNIRGYEQGICFQPETLRKGELPKAFVPALSWFSEAIRNCKPEDILTLMPEPELKLFMLFIGRTLCGRDNSLPLGEGMEKLVHKFRKMCIMYGKDPGVGKSTFCQWMIETMRLLGYTISTFNGIGDHFNMGEVYTSQMAYRDDTVQDDIKRVTQSSSFKAVVTGAQMRVQNKGTDAYQVTAECTLLMIANELNQALLFSSDVGAIDRMLVLYTYSKAQINQLPRSEMIADSPDLRPLMHVQWLAEKCDTEPHGLIAYLFRLSVDYFIEHVNAGTLEEEIGNLSSMLTFPVSNNALPNVVSAMQLSMLLRMQPAQMQTQGFPPLTNKATLAHAMECFSYVLGDKRAHIVRCAIKEDWLEKGRPMAHPWMGIRIISAASLVQAIGEIKQAERNKMATVDAAITAGFKMLCTVHNISVGSGKTYVKIAWDDCSDSSLRGQLLQLAQDIHDRHIREADILQDAYDDLKNSNVSVSLAHTELLGYDPDKNAKRLQMYYLAKKATGNMCNFIDA